MSQTLTITIDGVEGRVLPDSFGTVLRAVFELMKSTDARGWQVGTQRIAWRVSEAKLVNPLSLTSAADSAIPGLTPPDDLAVKLIDQFQEIAIGRRPHQFTDHDLKLARIIGVEARRSRSLVITGTNTNRVGVFAVSRKFSAQAAKLIRLPKQVRTEYASLEGTLIGLTNDPLKVDGSAKLREATTGADVSCHASPAKAAEMAKYLNRETRVVVYGDVTYEEDVPKRVAVEDFTAIPAQDLLPTLGDLHAMRLRPPDDASIEEFLEDLRGDE